VLVKSALDGRPRVPGVPISIAVVLDISGSMSSLVEQRSRLELAKAAVVKLIDVLAPNDALGLTVFNDQGSVVFPLTPVSAIAAARAT